MNLYNHFYVQLVLVYLSFSNDTHSTGRYHGALLTNDDEAEVACVHAGKLSGDLVHPLIYCPEIHFSEFASALADMKNSSAVRILRQLDILCNMINIHCGEFSFF